MKRPLVWRKFTGYVLTRCWTHINSISFADDGDLAIILVGGPFGALDIGEPGAEKVVPPCWLCPIPWDVFDRIIGAGEYDDGGGSGVPKFTKEEKWNFVNCLHGSFNIYIVVNMHMTIFRDLPVWVLLPVWICVAWDELNPTGGGALPTGIAFWGFPFSPWYTDGREAWRDSLLQIICNICFIHFRIGMRYFFINRNLCWWEKHVWYVWKKYSYEWINADSV